MERRLLVALLLFSTTASSFLNADGKKDTAGTCSGAGKKCGGEATSSSASSSSAASGGSTKDTGTCSGAEKKCTGEAPIKKAKQPTKRPIDISVMWKKPEARIGGHFYDEEKYDGKVAQAVLKKLEAKPRVLETACSKLTGVCYEVVDLVWRNPEGFEQNKWEMIRQVQLKGQVDSHFGRATLVKPQELNWKTYDTKKWEINKYAVIDKEIQTLIGGLTGSGAIPRNETAAAEARPKGGYQVLLVGLGTPVIPNFLSQYHWIDVVVVDKEPLFAYFAKKWFGMILHPTLRHILAADPISFMAFIVSQRHEMDAVLINQCKDYVDPRPCPADIYLERSTMNVIKNVVREETGVLGVNTRSSDQKHEKEVASAYEDVFPMCFDFPGAHKQLYFERYKSTICFNREHPPFWLGSSREYSYAATHEWFFYI